MAARGGRGRGGLACRRDIPRAGFLENVFGALRLFTVFRMH